MGDDYPTGYITVGEAWREQPAMPRKTGVAY